MKIKECQGSYNHSRNTNLLYSHQYFPSESLTGFFSLNQTVTVINDMQSSNTNMFTHFLYHLDSPGKYIWTAYRHITTYNYIGSFNITIASI